MNAAKKLAMLGVSSLLIFSGCASEPEKTPEAPKNPPYSAQAEIEKSDPDALMAQNVEYVENAVSEKNTDTDAQMEDPLVALFAENEPASPAKTHTLEEVSAHNTQEDCWLVVDGTVADMTSFFGKHPGGDENLLKGCGKDATEMFHSVDKHDPKGLKKFAVGTLAE